MTSRTQPNDSNQEEVAPQVSFSGDLGTFDLKFAESEDECFTQSSDLFGRSQLPCDQLVDAEGDHRTHTRKRKMDNEGFVTPATPDIPRTSHHYTPPDHSDLSIQERGKKDMHGDVDSEDPDGRFIRHAQRQSQGRFDQTGDTGGDRPLSQNLDKHKFYNSASEMFEDMAQRTKMLIIEMAQTFSESEEYESMALHSVEMMLEEAKSVESSLRHQKELLQKRLFMICQHLNETSH